MSQAATRRVCLNCNGGHNHVLSWRTCWLCVTLINPCAPRHSTAAMCKGAVIYVHEVCLAHHRRLKCEGREGLSEILVHSSVEASRYAAEDQPRETS